MLASGLFWMPKREDAVELAEPDDLPRHCDRAQLNAYLDRFYTHDALAAAARYIPYSRWERGRAHEMGEFETARAASKADAPAATREIVLLRLRKATGIDHPEDEQELARDLGLDSLAITDILLWLEGEFAVSVPHIDAIRTVGDLIMAACGRVATSRAVDVRSPLRQPRGSRTLAAFGCKSPMVPPFSKCF